jgi:hypothetical protein
MAALIEQSFSPSAAALLAEMSAAFSAGTLDGEYERGPTETTPTTLDRFMVTVLKPAFEEAMLEASPGAADTARQRLDTHQHRSAN